MSKRSKRTIAVAFLSVVLVSIPVTIGPLGATTELPRTIDLTEPDPLRDEGVIRLNDVCADPPTCELAPTYFCWHDSIYQQDYRCVENCGGSEEGG